MPLNELYGHTDQSKRLPSSLYSFENPNNQQRHHHQFSLEQQTDTSTFYQYHGNDQLRLQLPPQSMDKTGGHYLSPSPWGSTTEDTGDQWSDLTLNPSLSHSAPSSYLGGGGDKASTTGSLTGHFGLTQLEENYVTWNSSLSKTGPLTIFEYDGPYSKLLNKNSSQVAKGAYDGYTHVLSRELPDKGPPQNVEQARMHVGEFSELVTIRIEDLEAKVQKERVQVSELKNSKHTIEQQIVTLNITEETRQRQIALYPNLRTSFAPEIQRIEESRAALQESLNGLDPQIKDAEVCIHGDITQIAGWQAELAKFQARILSLQDAPSLVDQEPHSLGLARSFDQESSPSAELSDETPSAEAPKTMSAVLDKLLREATEGKYNRHGLTRNWDEAKKNLNLPDDSAHRYMGRIANQNGHTLEYYTKSVENVKIRAENKRKKRNQIILDTGKTTYEISKIAKSAGKTPSEIREREKAKYQHLLATLAAREQSFPHSQSFAPFSTEAHQFVAPPQVNPSQEGLSGQTQRHPFQPPYGSSLAYEEHMRTANTLVWSEQASLPLVYSQESLQHLQPQQGPNTGYDGSQFWPEQMQAFPNLMSPPYGSLNSSEGFPGPAESVQPQQGSNTGYGGSQFWPEQTSFSQETLQSLQPQQGPNTGYGESQPQSGQMQGQFPHLNPYGFSDSQTPNLQPQQGSDTSYYYDETDLSKQTPEQFP